jgi:hypothetical protein
VRSVLFDPRREVELSWNIRLVEVIDPGPPHVGQRVARTIHFLGRDFTSTYTITATDGETFLERTTEEPFPMKLTFTLEIDGDGTWVSAYLRGEGDGFFGLAGTVIGPLARAAMMRSLERLRVLIETR